MKNNTLTPQIRFKGFEEEWISKCFGDILISESYKSYLAEPTPNGLYPIIQQGDNPIVGYSNSSPFNEYEDVVLYGDHTTSVYKPLTPFLLSTDGLKMLKASGIIGTFLALSISTYGPKPEGYKRHFSILQTRTCCYPSNRAEQSAIGEYFRRVDELIAEAQREVSRLEKMKQASLQKMFPRPGESVPEVRFAGFTEDWKTVRLGDLFLYLKNNTLSRDCLNYESGIAKNMHYGDILIKYGSCIDVNDSIVPFVNHNIELDFTTLNLLANGDIIMADTAEDEAVGKCVEIFGADRNKVVSGLHTISLRPISRFAPFYLGYFLNSPYFHIQLLPLMQGVKVLSINRSALEGTKVSFPESLAEQAAIGEYFRNLDSLIDVRRRRVAKLRDIKKACLDKMFAAPAP